MSTPSKETVLIVGATGNIGISACIAVLRTGREVLAIVRNQESAEKIFHRIDQVFGNHDGITTVEADVTDPKGVEEVVEKVRMGELPGFQHVYACGELSWCRGGCDRIGLMRWQLDFGSEPRFMKSATSSWQGI
jgi:NAD(P)-dependent dehydrogenase (short-subunit alcohol dehydrogenase family)